MNHLTELLCPDTALKLACDPQHHDLIVLKAHNERKRVVLWDHNIRFERPLEEAVVIDDKLTANPIIYGNDPIVRLVEGHAHIRLALT